MCRRRPSRRKLAKASSRAAPSSAPTIAYIRCRRRIAPMPRRRCSYDCALARAARAARRFNTSRRRGFTVAISIYDQFVPVFTQMLSALDKVLSKAEADAAARKIDLDVFVNGRLAPDMLPLTRQIQIMTDQAKGCASRLAGQDPPKWADDEKTFADLHARVAKTIAHLKTLQARAVRRRREACDRDQVPERDVQLHGQGLLAELRDPELLFPLHDGVRDPAAQRRADRQGRLPRQPVAAQDAASFPRSPASEGPLRGRREYVPVGSLPPSMAADAPERPLDGGASLPHREECAWNTGTSGVLG